MSGFEQGLAVFNWFWIWSWVAGAHWRIATLREQIRTMEQDPAKRFEDAFMDALPHDFGRGEHSTNRLFARAAGKGLAAVIGGEIKR